MKKQLFCALAVAMTANGWAQTNITPEVLKALEGSYTGTPTEKALRNAIKSRIQEKDGSLVGNMVSQGTTPRRLTDLIGSLCDLTSGSGDKGTPIILVQGYFDNYTNA